MSEYLVIPTSSKDTGIFKVVTLNNLVSIYYWVHDGSWVQPGKIVAEYDRKNFEIEFHERLDVFNMATIVQILDRTEDSLFTRYKIVRLDNETFTAEDDV